MPMMNLNGDSGHLPTHMHIPMHRYNMITPHTPWELTDLVDRYTDSTLDYKEMMANYNDMD